MNDYDIVKNILITAEPMLKNVNLQLNDELYANCGIDSRIFIQIIRGIEEQLGHDINDEDLLEAELVTIQDLVNFFAKYSKSEGGHNDYDTETK